MESIAVQLRRGIRWVVVPLGIASLVRFALEPHYGSWAYLGWLALLPIFAGLQGMLVRRPAPWRIRLALLVNFFAINAGYLAIGAALRKGGWRADALVYAVDRAVFRGDPQRLLVPLQAPWLSTVVVLGYLGFFGYLLYLFLSEAFVLSVATGRLQLGLMRLYGIGFSGYLLLPAQGPAFDHPGLLPPIAHSAFSAKLDPWILAQCSRVDVCPSVHAAVCTFLLVWTWHRRRWLVPYLVLPSAALLLGTVYLQYHYFTDLPFGIALGACSALSVLPWPTSSPSPIHSARTSP